MVKDAALANSRREMARMPVELVAKKPPECPAGTPRRQGRAGLAPGLRPTGAVAWAEANGFSGEAGRTLLVPGADGAVAGALFGIGKRGRRIGRSPSAPWRRRCRKATGISPHRSRSPTSPRSALVARRLCLHPLRQEAGARLRFAAARGRRRRPRRRASPTASSWPATWSTRRPTTWGRTNWSSAVRARWPSGTRQRSR